MAPSHRREARDSSGVEDAQARAFTLPREPTGPRLRNDPPLKGSCGSSRPQLPIRERPSKLKAHARRGW